MSDEHEKMMVLIIINVEFDLRFSYSYDALGQGNKDFSNAYGGGNPSGGGKGGNSGSGGNNGGKSEWCCFSPF